MPEKFKKFEKTVNAFIILGIILILVSLVLIARGKRIFSRKYYFYSICKSADGLNKGMAINMNGFPIGTLESMKLDGNNNIAIKIAVYEEHSRRIRKGSVLRLISPILGSKTLEIIPGDINATPIANNGYIISYDSDEGKKILSEKMAVMPQSVTDSILVNVSELVKRLNDPAGPLFANLENFQVISKNVGLLSEKILTKEGKLDSIFKHAEETTANMSTISRSIMQSQFFKDKSAKQEKSASIDLSESYNPYQKK
ncbi:MAG: MlaD family protein [Elusimicrobiota bacterium]